MTLSGYCVPQANYLGLAPNGKDLFDVAHVGDESDQELEEFFWWLGVPITYHASIPSGGGATMTWTVPGR
jgi:hypothetical protein